MAVSARRRKLRYGAYYGARNVRLKVTEKDLGWLLVAVLRSWPEGDWRGWGEVRAQDETLILDVKEGKLVWNPAAAYYCSTAKLAQEVARYFRPAGVWLEDWSWGVPDDVLPYCTVLTPSEALPPVRAFRIPTSLRGVFWEFDAWDARKSGLLVFMPLAAKPLGLPQIKEPSHFRLVGSGVWAMVNEEPAKLRAFLRKHLALRVHTIAAGEEARALSRELKRDAAELGLLDAWYEAGRGNPFQRREKKRQLAREIRERKAAQRAAEGGEPCEVLSCG